METIISKLNINQSICESRESYNIVSFMKDENLSIDFILEYQNGNVWGVFYDEDENLTYQTNDGLEYKIKEGSVMLSEDEDVIFDESDDDCIRYPYQHAYLINDNGIIEKLDLEDNSADSVSGVRYYQGDKGALVIWDDADGTENAKKSGLYYTSSFNEFKNLYSDILPKIISPTVDELLSDLCILKHKIDNYKPFMIYENRTDYLDRLVYINSELSDNDFEIMDFCPCCKGDSIEIDDVESCKITYEMENHIDEGESYEESDDYKKFESETYDDIYKQYVELVDNIDEYLKNIDNKYGTDYSWR